MIFSASGSIFPITLKATLKKKKQNISQHFEDILEHSFFNWGFTKKSQAQFATTIQDFKLSLPSATQ